MKSAVNYFVTATICFFALAGLVFSAYIAAGLSGAYSWSVVGSALPTMLKLVFWLSVFLGVCGCTSEGR